MPRILRKDVLNELRIFDNISNSELVFYYRMPSEKERNKYSNHSVQRIRNKVVYDFAGARLAYGSQILQGIRDGDFLVPVSDHPNAALLDLPPEQEDVTISSDPNSPYYVSDWKERVADVASDLVMHLAMHVFDAPAETDTRDTAEKN